MLWCCPNGPSTKIDTAFQPHCLRACCAGWRCPAQAQAAGGQRTFVEDSMQSSCRSFSASFCSAASSHRCVCHMLNLRTITPCPCPPPRCPTPLRCAAACPFALAVARQSCSCFRRQSRSVEKAETMAAYAFHPCQTPTVTCKQQFDTCRDGLPHDEVSAKLIISDSKAGLLHCHWHSLHRLFRGSLRWMPKLSRNKVTNREGGRETERTNSNRKRKNVSAQTSILPVHSGFRAWAGDRLKQGHIVAAAL